MIRALSRPVEVPWRPLFVAGWFALNAALLLFDPRTNDAMLPPYSGSGHDYRIWVEAGSRFVSGTLYHATPDGYSYIFAPAMVWPLAVVTSLGYPVWAALHVAVLALLRDWRLVALVVLSVALWLDVIIGSTTTFVFVAGVLALRGSTAGALVYVTLFLLMPRPAHLPLAAWLAWHRPDLRWAFAVLVGLLIATTVATGYALEWTIELLSYGSYAMNDIGPTRFVGSAWLVVAVPVAVVLTMKGRVGLAGLAIAPYAGFNYLLQLFWDARWLVTQQPRPPR